MSKPSRSRPILGNNPACLLTNVLIGIVASLMMTSLTAQISADEQLEVEAKLNQIQQQLKQIAAQRQDKNEQLETYQQQAQKTAISLKEHHQRSGLLQRQENDLQTDLANLGQQAIEIQKTIELHQTELSAQVQAAYQRGFMPPFQRWLNHSESSSSNRYIAWQAIFVKRRQGLLEALGKQQEQLQLVREQIGERQNRLRTILDELQISITEQEALAKQQNELSQKIRQELTDMDQREAELALNQTQLEALLESLKDLFADIPDQPASNDFLQLKGKLAWPVTGSKQLLAKYGSQRSPGIQWSGIVIDSKVGETVKAVAPGRVAFADWMRGFGWLLVLEHDNGYMSLYGHNQELHQTTGNWVRTGEVLASSGEGSSTDNLDGVYFEIRRNGKPVDPLPWLSR